MIKKLKTFIFSLFYPEKCPFCQKTIAHNSTACYKCIEQFTSKAYLRVFKSNSIAHISEYTCISPLKYSDNVKDAIWRYKFRQYKKYAPKFALFIVHALKNQFKTKDAILEQFDFITSVPLFHNDLTQRGYNQSQLLAENIGNYLNLTYLEALLKIKNNKKQHNLSAKQRYLNVKGAYSCLNPTIIKDKKILLCDDIITTGSTLSECADTLIHAGAANVFCITLASTLLD
jgi:ComF family protein